MVDVLKHLVVPQKLAQIDLDDTNTIQMNQVITNPSKEEVTNPKIYPLTVKEIVETYNAHAKLKHFFKCNAALDKGLELQTNKDGYFSWEPPFDTIAPPCHVSALPYDECNFLLSLML
jgi:hypothetical protein